MNRLFLDTNVLIYAKDKSSSYHKWAFDLISQPYSFYTSSKNLSEYFAVVTKGDEPLLTIPEVIQDLSEIYDLCDVLYPTESSYSRLFSLISQYQPKGLLIHDFEIVSIALTNNIQKIATVNKKDFKRIADVEVISF